MINFAIESKYCNLTLSRSVLVASCDQAGGRHNKIRNLATTISLIMKVIFNNSSDVMMTLLLKKKLEPFAILN